MNGRSSIPGGGRFAMALVIFSVVYWLLPANARIWLAAIVLIGALSYGANIEVLDKALATLR